MYFQVLFADADCAADASRAPDCILISSTTNLMPHFCCCCYGCC